MNQKTLWSILAAVVIIILGFWMYNRDTEDAVMEDGATTTAEETAAVEDTRPVMEDGAGGPPVVARGAYTDGTYTLDTEESSVAWTGYKTLVKDYEDNGTLSFSSGSIVVGNGHITSGEFIIDMNSFVVLSTSSTGGTGSMLENHLKSDDFFSVATYPTATVALKNVVNGVVTADVTIKDITKTISFPANITETSTALSATATLSIDRTLWDVRYGSGTFFDNLGDNIIGDKVELVLTLSATRQ